MAKIHVNVPDDTLDALKCVSEHTDRTVSQLIRGLMREFVATPANVAILSTRPAPSPVPSDGDLDGLDGWEK